VLWISIGLSLLLAAISAAAIWYAIGRGMASMENAVRRVRSMHAAAPLAPINVDRTLPVEVLPLVQEINDLMRDLGRAHRLNQRFIADAAHQLRTPLATLRVQLDFALRETDPARHLRAIDDAIAVLTRMGRVLHQLLTLAKADESEPRADLPEGLVDVDAIAREEVERRLDDAVDGGIDLGYAGSGRPVPIRAVEELVREAVANLVDNALRYAGAGSHVTVGVDADAPEIYVEDDGPGIPAGERANVIQRFYRIAGTAADGCGLGLSIANEIAQRHGGRLALEAGSAGKGLRARLVFPALPGGRKADWRGGASDAVSDTTAVSAGGVSA
jgi:two-component system sensor histidine kinase TctE